MGALNYHTHMYPLSEYPRKLQPCIKRCLGACASDPVPLPSTPPPFEMTRLLTLAVFNRLSALCVALTAARVVVTMAAPSPLDVVYSASVVLLIPEAT